MIAAELAQAKSINALTLTYKGKDLTEGKL